MVVIVATDNTTMLRTGILRSGIIPYAGDRHTCGILAREDIIELMFVHMSWLLCPWRTRLISWQLRCWFRKLRRYRQNSFATSIPDA